MTWKFSSEMPVYLQIMDQIRGSVLSGEYLPGGKIPSVRDLAAQAQVNPNTVQHALHELEQEGLLIAHGTNGRFVTEDDQVLQKLREDRIRALALECAQKFAVLGLSPTQAAQELLGLERKDEHG